MQKFAIAILMVAVLENNLTADDWPTHLHDNNRSGKSTETLELPLQFLWQKRVSIPAPAWPAPAKQDYWHRKTNLRPRIVHDRANGIVVAGGRLVVGATSDDQVRALDATTGEQIWTTFAEGPIRLAPTIWNDLAVFAADDGFVYGVELQSGKLRWKTRPKEVGARRIPGNGRIISERPIRSGVMINEEGTGFFAAGIFPIQGAYFYSIDVRAGKILDRAAIEKSVQGYLQTRDGEVFAPTGRDPTGTALPQGETKRKGSNSKVPEDVYSQISDTAHQFTGRENEVTAMRNGENVWTTRVDGVPHCMAIADGKLFVSTDSGMIYAFGRTTKDSSLSEPTLVSHAPTTETKNRIYVLVVDPSDEEVDSLVDEVLKPNWQLVIVVNSVDRATSVREQLVSHDCYGQAVVHIHESTAEEHPYAQNIFKKVNNRSHSLQAALLLPRTRFQTSDPKDWTHAYGNPGNTASNKSRVGGGNLKLQWFGGPGPRNMVDRHMRTMPPLASHGVMYIPGLDRILAVDAYSGTSLWEEEIPNSTRIGILKDCGWLAAHGSSLYVAVRNELQEFHTQRETHTQSVKFKVPFPNREWGYLACLENQIIGSSTKPGASRKTVNRPAILEGAYSDNRPIVCSDGIFAFEQTKQATVEVAPNWTYRSSGAILNPSIAATVKDLFFVENEMQSKASSKLVRPQLGRITLADFWEREPQLVAVDIKTGRRRWAIDLPPVTNPQNAFVLCDAEHVVLVNSRNAETVFYDVRVFRTTDGTELWNQTQNNQKKPGGDHGEQDKHPVLIGNRLIVEPFAYDIATGRKLAELNLGKRGYGCGTLSGSADALFFRSGNPARYSLESNEIKLVTSVSRPGCWINMIPAEKLLLIPEGSSGCTCNYPIQTSMAFIEEE